MEASIRVVRDPGYRDLGWRFLAFAEEVDRDAGHPVDPPRVAVVSYEMAMEFFRRADRCEGGDGAARDTLLCPPPAVSGSPEGDEGFFAA